MSDAPAPRIRSRDFVPLLSKAVMDGIGEDLVQAIQKHLRRTWGVQKRGVWPASVRLPRYGRHDQ